MTAENTTIATASDILDALRRHYSRSALVPEVVIGTRDHEAWEIYYAAKAAGLRIPEPGQTRRIDALMFDGPQRTAIEIKVDRADVKRETFRKIAPWLEVTHRFVYAVPAGLIDPTDMAWTPSCLVGCGIWWVHDGGRVEVVRKASVRKYPEPLPQHVITALAYRAAGVDRIVPQARS